MRKRLLAALLVFAALSGLSRAEEPVPSAPPAAKKPLIVAHYMTWFGRPETSGQWYQWKFALPSVGIDKHHYPDLILPNGRRDIAAVDYPSIGPYDSTDPDVLEYHILLAKESGIDAFMVNWYGFEHQDGSRFQEDRGFEQLLKVAERLNFKVCLNFDDKCAFPPYRGFNRRAQAVAYAKQVLERAMKRYGSSPAYLKIDGRPVLSNFGVAYTSESDPVDRASFALSEWEDILKSLSVKPYFIHDHQWQWRKTIEEAGFWRISDSIFCWIGTAEERIAFLQESRRLADEGKLKMVTGLANPGFDNTPCWGWGAGVSKVPRRGGQEYRDHWEECLKYGAGFIQVVTWNDFTEGSTIEPTEEYGDKYLRITAEYANRLAGTDLYGRALDLPKRIYEVRKGAESLGAARQSSAELLTRISSETAQAVGALTRHDRDAADRWIAQAQSAVEGEAAKLPKPKRIEAQLSPATSELFAGETGQIVLHLKNPLQEKIPLYIEVDHTNIPRSWLGELEKAVWLNPGEEKDISFPVRVPPDAEEKLGWFTASVDSPYLPVASNVAYLNVAQSYLKAGIGPVNLLRAGRKEDLKLELQARLKAETSARVALTAPSGWTVDPKETSVALPKKGSISVPFKVEAPAGAKPGNIVATVFYGNEQKTVREPVAVLPEGQAAVLEGDIDQDGVEDYVLGNAQTEVHVTPIIGGRILAIIPRETGSNQLYLNYPGAARTQGDTWDKWSEYGGINDWFPGEWPGSVWNNDWDARVTRKGGERASVLLHSRPGNGPLGISKEISLGASSPEVRVDYRLENSGSRPQGNIFWTSHPDLAPGPADEATTDDWLVVPTTQTESGKDRFQRAFSARMDKTLLVPDGDWMLAYDSRSHEYLGEAFDRRLLEKVGLWEGHDFFTMELIFNKLNLGAGEKKEFSVYYLPGSGDLESAVRSLKELRSSAGK